MITELWGFPIDFTYFYVRVQNFTKPLFHIIIFQRGILLIHTALGIYCCKFSRDKAMKAGFGGNAIKSYVIIPMAYSN